MSKRIDLVQKYQTHKGDTGSVEVQVALLTERIKSLSKHLTSHKKDTDSRRGLLMMVSKRRRLLNYIRQSNAKKYIKITSDLKLRAAPAEGYEPEHKTEPKKEKKK